MRIFVVSTLFAFVVTGCAAAGAAGSPDGGSRDEITRAQFRQLDDEGLTAWEVVERLRPQWLRSRGTASFNGDPALPRVVLDRVPYGEIGELRGLDASVIEEMRYMGAGNATTRFGTGYDGGAILVTTR